MFHANAWGTAVRRLDGRRRPHHARPVPAGGAAARASSPRSAPRSRARCRRSGPTSCATRETTTSTCRRCAWSLCGGSAVPRALMERFEARYGVRIIQGWGMTETSPLAAVAHPPTRHRAGHARGAGLARARPAASSPGVELRIVDDDGAVLPWDGEAVGEIEVRGPWITGVVLPRPRAGEVRRRLAAHRRRRHASTPERLHADHRPRQGRHQVGRRVDLVGRARERAHGAPRRRRGRGDRRPRRALERAAARLRRAQARARRRRRRRSAAFLAGHVAHW